MLVLMQEMLLVRPGYIMLFKLPIMFLSNAPKFSLLCPNYALLCPVMLHKFIKVLLPESEDKPITCNQDVIECIDLQNHLPIY